MVRKPRTAQSYEYSLYEIWNGWSPLYFHKVDALDYMTRCIIRDMKIARIPESVFIPYLRKRLADTIERIAENYLAEGDS
jgi:hypothetical protein